MLRRTGIALCLSGATAAASATGGALASLVAAERAFAASSPQVGVKAAFLGVLAEDSVLFRPGPVDGRGFIDRRPDPPIILTWYPSFAVVAGSGELGLTFGPWELRPKEPSPAAKVDFGHFISVWRRVPEGPWRLLVDLGVSHPRIEPAVPEFSVPADSPEPVCPPLSAEERAAACRDLVACEAGLAGRLATGLRAEAYAECAAADARFFREGRPPRVGLAALGPDLEGESVRWLTSLHRCEVSAGGDFGFTISTGGQRPTTARPADRNGEYAIVLVRVWRRSGGVFRLFVEVLEVTPLPGS